MKIRFRHPNNHAGPSTKFTTMRNKYKRMKLITILIIVSWFAREIIRYY